MGVTVGWMDGVDFLREVGWFMVGSSLCFNFWVYPFWEDFYVWNVGGCVIYHIWTYGCRGGALNRLIYMEYAWTN